MDGLGPAMLFRLPVGWLIIETNEKGSYILAGFSLAAGQ